MTDRVKKVLPPLLAMLALLLMLGWMAGLFQDSLQPGLAPLPTLGALPSMPSLPAPPAPSSNGGGGGGSTTSGGS